MDKKYCDLLIHIASKTNLFDTFESSTTKIAEKIGSSQQTVSRILKEMEDEGLISRKASFKGVEIRLTEKSIKELKNIYKTLDKIFQKQHKKITGKLVTGLGEGKFYMSLEGYKRQFIEKINIRPFKGTLNLKIKENEVRSFISDINPVMIDSFDDKERTFGKLIAYRTKIKEIPCAMIIPERTHHKKHVIEIISEHNLRKKIGLKDGDEVTLG